MIAVVDANVIYAMVIRPYGVTSQRIRELFLLGWTLYVPQYLHEELERTLSSIAKKKGLDPLLVKERVGDILQMFTTVPLEKYATFIPQSLSLVNDPTDAPYVALALHLTTHHNKVTILTYNTKDYKTEALSKLNIHIKPPTQPL